MARSFDLRSTVLIVVRHGILPRRRTARSRRGSSEPSNERAAVAEDRSAVVVTDVWLLNERLRERFPAIAIGGPGINALTAQVYEELSVALAREQRASIQ
jgi:hypothetical protein